MLRVIATLALAASLLAACGGNGDASPSAAASAAPPQTEAPIATPETTPAADTPPPTPAGGVTVTAICGAVALRAEPKKSAQLVTRIAEGSTVHVSGRVKGDKYVVSGCGTSGSAWVRIDFIDGIPVMETYGVPEAFAAAGFFK